MKFKYENLEIRRLAVGETVFTWGGSPVVAYEAKVIKSQDAHGFALLEYYIQEQDLDGNDYESPSKIRTWTNLIYFSKEEAFTDGSNFSEFIESF